MNNQTNLVLFCNPDLRSEKVFYSLDIFCSVEVDLVFLTILLFNLAASLISSRGFPVNLIGSIVSRICIRNRPVKNNILKLPYNYAKRHNCMR